MDRILILVIAFIIGLIIDMFYNSFGVHTSASVLLAFLRFYWGNIITPQGGYEINISPNLKTMGFQWFSTYFLPMLFVHHFTLFFTEAGGFFLFWFTLLKVIMSTFFTFLVILLIQILFFSRKRGI
ncbi:MAG: Rod shape-determining protein MreD [Cyclobacteriaceae bacterium]|nr:Rod shape-determining protein MreD [Cyclobacteriaceae bacterium]